MKGRRFVITLLRTDNISQKGIFCRFLRLKRSKRAPLFVVGGDAGGGGDVDASVATASGARLSPWVNKHGFYHDCRNELEFVSRGEGIRTTRGLRMTRQLVALTVRHQSLAGEGFPHPMNSFSSRIVSKSLFTQDHWYLDSRL